MADSRWTAKFPALAAGLVSIVVAFILAANRYIVIGATLLFVGIALVIWSESIKNWCVPNEYKFGYAVFDEVKFHDPSFYDCLYLTGIIKRPNQGSR